MSTTEDQHKLQTAYALHQKGDLREAAKLYRELVKRNPNNFHALHFLGLVEAGAGNIEQAKPLMARSLFIQPPNVQFVENYATLLYRAGDYDAALEICRKGLQLANSSASLLYIYAVSLFRLDKLPDSLAQFDKLLRLQPKHAAALNERGSVLARMSQYDVALASVAKALDIDPKYADAHLNMGNLYSLLKRYDEALAAYDKALTHNPALANARLGRGNVFRALKRYDEAFAAYGKALALDPALASAWLGRGNAFRELNRLEEALASYDRALALDARYAEACGDKGMALLELGRFKEASDAMEKAIDLAPKRVHFYLSLGLSKRLTRDDPHLRAMQELAQDMSSLAVDEQIELNFALGKALADIGDREHSFARLLDGAALKRGQMNYDEAAILGVLERTRSAFAGEMMRSHSGQGDPSDVPVFILGMPRSGTTLVEQILASHPKVFGAGEIPDFHHAVAGFGGAVTEALHSPEAAARISREQWRELGASYVGRIKAMAPAAERITNKVPENFRFVGLIHLALPKARIIHTRRDPVDTCLSCFSTLFAEDLPYTYDLAELGRYYRAYEALMAHWRDALPQDAMLEVRYEEVVDDLEGQARRILAYCGLEWDARCLDFHQTARSVRTASVAQVRQPIYQGSVGRWRAYESFLGPLLAELGPDAASAGAEPM